MALGELFLCLKVKDGYFLVDEVVCSVDSPVKVQLKKGTVLDVCFVMDCCRSFVKVFVVIVNRWFRCGFLLLMKKFLPCVLACLVHSKIPASHMITDQIDSVLKAVVAQFNADQLLTESPHQHLYVTLLSSVPGT
ncbi:unnamed protein product [Brassica oleracea]